MGILEMLFGGGQGGEPQPLPRDPQPYLPGRTRMPFEIPTPPEGGGGGGDNTAAFLSEWMRRRGVDPGGQAQPMGFRPGEDPSRTAQPYPDMPGAPAAPGGWYQGPAEPPAEQRLMEWLSTQPKPPPSRLNPMPGGPPPNMPMMPMAPPSEEDIIPGSPGRPWPKMGEPGYLDSRTRMRPDMLQGGPMPSPFEEMGPLPQPPPLPPTDPGWIEPRNPNVPGYTGYRRPPEGQMVEVPQPLWPSKRRTA